MHMSEDYAIGLWWSMHVVPAALTVTAVFWFRGIRLGVALLGIALVAWMLMISAAVATENVARGGAPGGCGMLSGVVMLFGWIYGGFSVTFWTAVALYFRWGIELAIHLIKRAKSTPPLPS